jgi:hypothetical protein
MAAKVESNEVTLNAGALLLLLLLLLLELDEALPLEVAAPPELVELVELDPQAASSAAVDPMITRLRLPTMFSLLGCLLTGRNTFARTCKSTGLAPDSHAAHSGPSPPRADDGVTR